MCCLYFFPVFNICAYQSVIRTAQVAAAASPGLLPLCSQRDETHKPASVKIRDQNRPSVWHCSTTSPISLAQAGCSVGGHQNCQWVEIIVNTSCVISSPQVLRTKVHIIWLSQHIRTGMILGSFSFVHQQLECVWMQSRIFNFHVG